MSWWLAGLVHMRSPDPNTAMEAPTTSTSGWLSKKVSCRAIRSGGIRSSASIRMTTGALTAAMQALSPATMPRFWSNRMTRCGLFKVASMRAAKGGVLPSSANTTSKSWQVCAFKSPNIFSKLASGW